MNLDFFFRFLTVRRGVFALWLLLITTGVHANPGNALDFDGTDDYVEVPYDAALNPPVITMAAWAKVTGSTFYVNGVPFGAIHAGMNPNSIDVLHICRQITGVVYGFVGEIDEVRIWNTARTVDEIRAYMTRDIPSPTTEAGLVAYYQFDSGIPSGTNTGTTQALDSTLNGYNGTLTNFALSGATSNWVDSEAYNIWTGATDTAWATAGNWSDGIPGATDNVHIPNVANKPALNNSSINHLVIEAGGDPDDAGTANHIEVAGNAFALGGGHAGDGVIMMTGGVTLMALT